MTPDGKQNLNAINATHHIEGLSSVADRVVRKKQQQKQKQDQKRKPKKHIDEQLEEDLAAGEDNNKNSDGHIDFRA
ncbi:MAG: hypothetical protein KAR47_20180 [Planctomycetes bacterium]|nr:hypothetical protein [Planctomycetota bacterium]